MTTRHPGRRRGPHGWILIESALTLSLVAVLTVTTFTAIDRIQGRLASDLALQDLERSENALVGYAQAHARLPAPDDGAPSATRPGYVEGWLPLDALGLSSTRRMRYIVEASLLHAPPPYDPDPLRLTAGRIGARGTINGLDLCWQLMRLERAGTALPGGMRLGFGIQQAVWPHSGAPFDASQMWLEDASPGTPPAGVRLDTRTRGPGEFAATLGCFERFSRLSAGVRSTAAALDLLRLARQEMTLRQLNLDLIEDSLLNMKWRLINWSIAIEKFVLSMVLEFIGMETTPISIAKSILNVISLAGAIAGTSWLINTDREGIDKGNEALDQLRTRRDHAKAQVARLQAEVEAQTRRTLRLQASGLNP